ncbi:MAG TPA: hypothetical protein VMT12_12010 [Syntrophales bacterium]|nr:hypothetical protein [Syntrophales bacterium]
MSCGAALDHTAADNVKTKPAKQLLKSAQLIIKFRDHTLDPSRNDFVQGLSRDAKATLVYVRPMSGGAHVFRVENISDAAQIAEVIKRLSGRQDVLYVEQDTIMYRQQEK